jgi:hypothetical protein
MLFERRAYTTRPGQMPAFWQLQEQWCAPHQIPKFLARNVGYFETLAGPFEQVVHLYRYDSFDDWKTRLFSLYAAERADYFVAARKLLTAQDNMFLELAPVPEMNPLWGNRRDWRPGEPAFPHDDTNRIVVVETTLDFLPGGLATYWAGLKDKELLADPLTTENLIACFHTLVGPQHRVIEYRWFADEADAARHRAALHGAPHWRRFADAFGPAIARSHVAYLRPSPVSWMRALFTPVAPYET